MQQTVFTVAENLPLTKTVYRMRLAGDSSAVTAPGQFVNLLLDGCFLRRPISVCDADESGLTLIYKVVGEGTGKMSRFLPGQTLDVLTGLGNGYDLTLCGERPVLLGGGVGVPPMYLLAKKLLAQGKTVSVVLGFNTAEEIFYEEEFRALGCAAAIATADGTAGVKGFVTDPMKDMDYSYVYTCGPEPMLKAVYKTCTTSAQFSFEERMGCGTGICYGCSCHTILGARRVCADGPVFDKEEILW